MKVVAALLFTLGVASAQKTIMQAPEVIVYYLNENMPADVCDSSELKYIDNKITPDLDMILHQKNFGDTVWQMSADAATRKLRGGEDRDLSANCDWCRRNYPRYLCNAMYNCGFRRQLQTGVVLTDAQKSDLATALKTACKENLMLTASRNVLRGTCGKAISSAECYVEFN